MNIEEDLIPWDYNARQTQTDDFFIILDFLGVGFQGAFPKLSPSNLQPILGLVFPGLWLPRLRSVLVLPLLGCGCAQASPCLVLAFAGLWLSNSLYSRKGLTPEMKIEQGQISGDYNATQRQTDDYFSSFF